MRANSSQSPVGDAPPWKRADLLPLNTLEGEWGMVQKGALHSMPLDNLLANLRKGRDTVALVAEPGRERCIPVAECAPFRPVILEADAKSLTAACAKNGWGFMILAAVCGAGFAFESGPAIFLLAIYACGFGAAYLESRAALGRLKSNPEAYLDNSASEFRHSYWRFAGTHASLVRTYAITGTWAALGIIQYLVVLIGLFAGVGNGERLDFRAAALVKSLVTAEPWRLLTGTMLHGSIMHLFMNAAGGFALGLTLERDVHRTLIAPVWLVGALAGSLLSWAASPITSVGASGGLMSMFGFLLVMSWRRRSHLPSDYLNGLLRNLVVTAVFGIFAWEIIDNAAHLGGLLAGGTMGLMVFRQPNGELPLRDSKRLFAVGTVSEAAFIAIAVFTALKLVTAR